MNWRNGKTKNSPHSLSAYHVVGTLEFFVVCTDPLKFHSHLIRFASIINIVLQMKKTKLYRDETFCLDQIHNNYTVIFCVRDSSILLHMLEF